MSYERYKIWLTVKNKTLDLTYLLIGMFVVTLPISYIPKAIAFSRSSASMNLAIASTVSVAASIFSILEIFILWDYCIESMSTINYYTSSKEDKKKYDFYVMTSSIIRSSILIYITLGFVFCVMLKLYLVVVPVLLGIQKEKIIYALYKLPLGIISIVFIFLAAFFACTIIWYFKS